jgi:hypothetical protein
MSDIALKDVPEDLRAQLENEAAANFRSLTQEALARLERTFEIDAANEHETRSAMGGRSAGQRAGIAIDRKGNGRNS